MNKNEAIARLIEMAKAGSFLQVGRLLARMQGGLSPADYAEARTKARISYRTARYLIVVFEASKALSISRKICMEVGWTKLAAIAPILTMDNKEHWIARAKELTVPELNAEIQQGQGDNQRSVQVNFIMTAEE